MIVPRTALVTEYIGRLSESGCAVCLPGLGGCGRASRTSAVGGAISEGGRSNGVYDSLRVEGRESAESVVSAQAVASSDRSPWLN